MILFPEVTLSFFFQVKSGLWTTWAGALNQERTREKVSLSTKGNQSTAAHLQLCCPDIPDTPGHSPEQGLAGSSHQRRFGDSA